MDDPQLDNENRIESESEDNPEDESLVEDSDEDLDNWNLNYDNECDFWIDLKNKGFIYIPEICPTFNKGKIEIKKYNSENIVNLYYIRCNYSKCKKNIRTLSFMIKIKNLPASIIFEFLENFFLFK